MSNEQEQACKNPIEDQRKQALEHYNELATKCCHWSSFVENAIKAYNPDSGEQQPVTGELRAKLIEHFYYELKHGCRETCYCHAECTRAEKLIDEFLKQWLEKVEPQQNQDE